MLDFMNWDELAIWEHKYSLSSFEFKSLTNFLLPISFFLIHFYFIIKDPI